MTTLLVVAGGMTGAVARYLIDRAVTGRWGDQMPWGTWVVNVFGSFLLGSVTAWAGEASWPEEFVALAGTGLCGALTTYSTFGLQVVVLVEQGRGRVAAGYAMASLMAGVVAGVAGQAGVHAIVA
ncbi:MAG: fluoride efflux transporter CrcB [Angustibacter sp.]